MTQISTAAELRQKIEANRHTFTFPVLGITIQYRRPDVLKLALNNQLPTVLADQVIKAYKANLEGKREDYVKDVQELKLEADNTFLTEIRERGYGLLSALCLSHKIMDVKESDFDNLVISWADIPEEDAIAFTLYLLQQAQNATTADGGEISDEEISTFPKGKRRAKRSTAG